MYQIKAAFIPEVNDELDTQNFEKFDEVGKSLPYFKSILKFNEVGNFCHFVLSSHDSFMILQDDKHIQSTKKAGPWRKVCI